MILALKKRKNKKPLNLAYICHKVFDGFPCYILDI